MRFLNRRTNRALVIGFYHSPDIARSVLTKLRRDGFRRSAAVHSTDTGEVRAEEHGVRVGRGAWSAALIGLLLGIAVLLPPHVLGHPGAIGELALQLAACTLAGGLAGWLLFRWLDMRVDRAHLEKFQRW